jgi:hypothetical protein
MGGRVRRNLPYLGEPSPRAPYMTRMLINEQRLAMTPDEARKRGLGVRFTSYARRVRALNLDAPCRGYRGCRGVVDGGVLTLWMSIPGLFPLYSSLTLDVGVPGWGDWDQMRTLIAPPTALTALTLSLDRRQETLSETLMNTLAGGCMRLETLKLDAGSSNIDTRKDWPQLLRTILVRATHLRVLTSTIPLHYADLMVLAESPYLEELSAMEVSDVPDDVRVLPCGAFASIRQLALHDPTCSAKLTHAIFTSCSSTTLTKLHLSLAPARCLMWERLGEIFARVGAHAHLSALSIIIPTSSHFACDDYNLSTLLRTLHTLANLETLFFIWDLDCVVSDTSVVELVGACPRLRIWRFVDSRGMTLPRAPRCTMPLEDLLDLLRSRPALQEIPVVVSAITPELQSGDARLDYGPLLIVEGAIDVVMVKETVRGLLPAVRDLRVLCGNLVRPMCV